MQRNKTRQSKISQLKVICYNIRHEYVCKHVENQTYFPPIIFSIQSPDMEVHCQQVFDLYLKKSWKRV